MAALNYVKENWSSHQTINVCILLRNAWRIFCLFYNEDCRMAPYVYRMASKWMSSDFVLQPPKSGVNTARLEQVRTFCFSRQAPGATLGHIFFGFKAQSLTNSEKFSGIVWKIYPSLGTFLGQSFPGNAFGLFTVCTIFNRPCAAGAVLQTAS